MDVTIFAAADVVWTRIRAHDTEDIKLVMFADAAESEQFTRTIDADFDLMIINSLPARPSNQANGKRAQLATLACTTNFIKAIESVKVPMVLIQHDHTKTSIKRSGGLSEAVKRANVLFAHSVTNDFAVMADEILDRNGIGSFFGDASETPMFGFQPGMEFDHCRDSYATTDPPTLNAHRWIGRTTSWKGYYQMFQFHKDYLRKNGQVTMLEGMERCIALVDIRKRYDFIEHPHRKDEHDDDHNIALDTLPHVFGPYNHDKMLKRMARAGFGYQLSLLKDRYIERSIEYTHCEVACTGTVPVFRKEFGELCTHRSQNKPLIECEGNGTIWLGDDNGEECWEEMKRINADPALRRAKAAEAFKFYRDHQDSEFTFTEMWKKITDNV